MSIIKSGLLGGSNGTTGSIPIKFSISLFNEYDYVYAIEAKRRRGKGGKGGMILACSVLQCHDDSLIAETVPYSY